MAIEVVRIDDRLIHGQIVQGWLKTVFVNRILVVSDEVAEDEMQKALLSMAVPSTVELSIKNIKDASVEIINKVYDKDKVMVLFSNPCDIVKMMDNGVKFNSVNVGGMHFVHGKKQLMSNVSVDGCDVEAFLKLISCGIELESRILPNDERHSISDNIKKEAELLGINA